MRVKSGPASSVSGAERGRTSGGGVDEVEKFKKCSGGDDQMDAGEFAAAVREILGKGTSSKPSVDVDVDIYGRTATYWRC